MPKNGQHQAPLSVVRKLMVKVGTHERIPRAAA